MHWVVEYLDFALFVGRNLIQDSGFLTLEAFAQHQYNALKLLKKRFLTGAGPRLRIIDKEKLSCYVGLLGMHEYEELTDSLKTIKEFFRLGSYGSMKLENHE